MATTTLTALLEGRAEKVTNGTIVQWTSQVRNASSADFIATYGNSTTNTSAFRAYLQLTRGGAQGRCSRTFLFWNNFGTGVAGNITAAQVKIPGSTSNISLADNILIESTAWNDGADTTLDAGDYSLIDYSNAYCTLRTSWGIGYNTITLNSNAISDMNTNGYLNTALIEGQYDYGNTNPSTGTQMAGTVQFKNSSSPIELILTYSTGYSHDINGVPSGDIVSVNGVVTADIVSFNGVS
jgi:hypothetical protein